VFAPSDAGHYAEVLLPLAVGNTFIYSVPLHLLEKVESGKRVLVQFGRRKVYTGIVVSLPLQAPERYEIKSIIDVLDENPVVTKKQIDFWFWMAEYYCCYPGEVMSSALPSSMTPASESKICNNDEYEGSYQGFTEKEMLVIDALNKQKELSVEDIQIIIGIKSVAPFIKHLQESGIIYFKEEVTESYTPKKAIVYFLHEDFRSNKSLQLLFDELEKAPKQLEILMNFRLIQKSENFVLHNDLMSNKSLSLNALLSLVKKGILIKQYIEVDRIEFEKTKAEKFELKDFQKTAIEQIKEQWATKDTVLLHGITSSGKTHIYIKLIEETLSKGKQVLYLIPEIALTTQLIRKLRSSFGPFTGVYHSKYNPFERYETWFKVLNNEYQLVLGVRSALFLPFTNLGLIIVDEEHESTFKQHSPAPRYHARDAAIILAANFKAKTLLGTATPSLESYYNAETGKFGLVNITKRYSDVQPPEIQLVDMKTEYKKHSNKANLSSVLFEKTNEIVGKGEQVILFLNRRGYAPVIECNQCNWIVKCKNCDISLTYHKHSKMLHCHYCGSKKKIPASCEVCGGNSLLLKGYGTEKVEDDISILFPDTKILRLDLDTTRSKRSYQRIIECFEKREANILIGTQMVTKGLDFEHVKLVGILNADQMITYPDFRSSERSFQLIMQVSGRAGRRDERGKVMIQTFDVSRPIFSYITENDYIGFYKDEAYIRKNFNYPPFSRLINITLKAQSLDMLLNGSKVLANRLRLHFGERLLGPEFPPVMRIRNEFLNQMLLKFERNNKIISAAKKTILQELGKFNFEPDFRKIRCVVDVDPF